VLYRVLSIRGHAIADTEPTCHVTPARLQVRENDRVEVDCTVIFSGSIAPSIDCRWSGDARWRNVRSSITNSSVLVELSIVATPILEGQHVCCTIWFANDSVRSSDGRSLYQHAWTSPSAHLITGNCGFNYTRTRGEGFRVNG